MHYVETGRRRAVWGGEAGGRKGESPQAPDRVGIMLLLLTELRSSCVLPALHLLRHALALCSLYHAHALPALCILRRDEVACAEFS